MFLPFFDVKYTRGPFPTYIHMYNNQRREEHLKCISILFFLYVQSRVWKLWDECLEKVVDRFQIFWAHLTHTVCFQVFTIEKGQNVCAYIG